MTPAGRAGSYRRPVVLDGARRAGVVGAVALSAVAVALVESSADQRVAELGPVGLGVALGQGVAVLLAARWPLVGTGLAVALFPVFPLALGTPGPGGAQLIVLMGLLGWTGFRCSTRSSVVAYLVAVTVSVGTALLIGETVWEVLFFGVLFGLACGTGVLLRRERARGAELRRLTEQLRLERGLREQRVVEEERARISRELHDAVAHSMSVMTLQVGVVRHRLADRPVERDALAGVEELGRRSVDELRRIVGLVRDGDADALTPAPSLRRLDELVRPLADAGVDVRLQVEGEAQDLPAAMDASVYRVAQEALSNALRHAPGASVAVRLCWGQRQVRLEVVDDGARGPRSVAGDDGVRGADGVGDGGTRGGHGLVGMRERVALFGGRLEAGPDGRGWAVRADLPVPA